MGFLDKVKTAYEVSVDWLGENSPAILTGVGVVGLAATAVLTYKSASRVESVVEYVEQEREEGREIDKRYVATELTGALALPVATGVAAIFCIISSYQIMNNRVTVLSTAFSALSLEYNRYRQKYATVHGQEQANQFFSPTETEVTNDGEEREVATPSEFRGLTGVWFSESSEYASDNHQYNIAYIEAVIKKLEVQMYNKTKLKLNEVYEAFGVGEDRQGALLGFTYDDFHISFEPHLNLTSSVDGKNHPDVWISWSTPKYLWGNKGEQIPALG